MVQRRNSLCKVGIACMYGAIIWVCFLKYARKVSLAHWPFTLMTSKGTFHSKYSKVEPIHILCPCRGSRPAAFVAEASLLRNFVFVRGRWVLSLCRYAKRAKLIGGSLTHRWFKKASSGSDKPACLAQWTSSPSGADFVRGRWKFLVVRFCHLIFLYATWPTLLMSVRNLS
jgi:hypothetical protein